MRAKVERSRDCPKRKWARTALHTLVKLQLSTRRDSDWMPGHAGLHYLYYTKSPDPSTGETNRQSQARPGKIRPEKIRPEKIVGYEQLTIRTILPPNTPEAEREACLHQKEPEELAWESQRSSRTRTARWERQRHRGQHWRSREQKER